MTYTDLRGRVIRKLSAIVRSTKLSIPAHWLPVRWLRRLETRSCSKLCVFVVLSRHGDILPHSVDHARAWKQAGYGLLVVIVASSLTEEVDIHTLDFADGILLRANIGYDFGAWASAICRTWPVIESCQTVAIANDSLLGPSSAFSSMMDRVDALDADLIGLTSSLEIERHFQSYVIFFKQRAIRAPVFRRFWFGVGMGNRDQVISNYEVPMLRRFAQAGMRTTAVFEAIESGIENPTLRNWKKLLDVGFPYIKIMLLRDNPYGEDLQSWRHEAELHGFNMLRIDQQITKLKMAGSGDWAYD